MNQTELEMLISQITQQVVAAMGGGTKEESCCCEGYRKMLVVGKSSEMIPDELSHNTSIFDMDDYRQHRNALRYDRLVIARLTMTQLADIALGRISDDETCAVLNALLNGVEVWVLDRAFPHRKYAGKGSGALYKTLEGYVQTLQKYGVKPYIKKVKDALPPPPPPKYKAPEVKVPVGSGKPNSSKLITEVEARALVEQGSPVILSRDAILTPLAKDIFAGAKVELKRE